MSSDYIETTYGRITASNKVELLLRFSDHPSVTLVAFVKAGDVPKYVARGFSKTVSYTGKPKA